MNYEQKTFVVTEIAKLLKKTSQNKLAVRAGISAGYLSQMVNGKWDDIADKTWLTVALNLNIKWQNTWNVVETKGHKQFFKLIEVARRRSMSVGVAGDAGFGKSAAFEDYCHKNNKAYHILCDDFWTKKMWVENFLRTLGEDPTGLTMAEMCQDIILKLKSIPNPIVFIDETDKIGEFLILFYITLYNKLDGHCCFFISGSPFFEKNVIRRAAKDKRGYKEFYSRIGRRFINPQRADLEDVTLICKANGVTDEDEIYRIFKTSEYDLRRVKREVLKLQELKARNNAA